MSDNDDDDDDARARATGGPRLHDVVTDLLEHAVDMLDKFAGAISGDVCQLLTLVTAVDAYGHALKLQHVRGARARARATGAARSSHWSVAC